MISGVLKWKRTKSCRARKKKIDISTALSKQAFFSLSLPPDRQDNPPIHKRIQHQTRKCSKQQIENIKTPSPDSPCTPMGLDLNFYTHFLFFSTRISGFFRVFTIKKGEGRERKCDKWIRNEWFRWLRALIRVDDRDIGDFHLLRLFSNGTKKFETKLFFPIWRSEGNINYLFLCKKGYSTVHHKCPWVTI